MGLKVLISLAIILLGSLSYELLAQVQEPLIVRSQGVGHIFRLALPDYGVTQQGYDKTEMNLYRTVSNYWSRDRRYQVDSELIDDGARISHVWASGLRLGMGFNTRRFALTATDQAAITFHDVFLMGQDGRLEAGKDKLRYRIPDYNLEYTAFNKNQIFSERTSVDLSVPLPQFYEQLNLALTFISSIEISRAAPFPYGSQDRAWQLNGFYLLDHMSVFGSVSQTFFDTRDDSSSALASQQMGWTLGAGQWISRDQELLGQMMVFQPVFRQLGQLSRNTYEIHLAYRHHWGRLALEATLIENIFWLYNTPDWGLCLGLKSVL